MVPEPFFRNVKTDKVTASIPRLHARILHLCIYLHGSVIYSMVMFAAWFREISFLVLIVRIGAILDDIVWGDGRIHISIDPG